jgi:2-polyprenyl-3-methyl-5-hydroxy-6-metoxy-1,4-benzoquinol methylase
MGKIDQQGYHTPQIESRWAEGVDFIISKIKERPEAQLKILDVGCGDGGFFRYFLSRAKHEGLDTKIFELHGVDMKGSYKGSVESLGVTFHELDFSEIDGRLPNASFDFIISAEVIEHVLDTDSHVLMLKKMVTNDGYIYLTTPNMSSWHSRLFLLFGFQPMATEVSLQNSTFGKLLFGKRVKDTYTLHHIRVFTLRALVDFVEFHGFTVVKKFGGGYRFYDNILFRGPFVGLGPICKLILKKN